MLRVSEEPYDIALLESLLCGRVTMTLKTVLCFTTPFRITAVQQDMRSLFRVEMLDIAHVIARVI